MGGREGPRRLECLNSDDDDADDDDTDKSGEETNVTRCRSWLVPMALTIMTRTDMMVMLKGMLAV